MNSSSAIRPSWWGILVYSDPTSNVTIRAFSGRAYVVTNFNEVVGVLCMGGDVRDKFF
jgi:hypothetical protein